MRSMLPTVSVLFFAGLLAGCGGSDGGDVASVAEENQDASGSADEGGSANGPDGNCEPEAYQAELLRLVNAARSEARMCGDQSYAAAGSLTYSCGLEQAASTHSEDMATNNFISHTGSNGLGVSDRVEAAGYAWSAVGENIAGGYASPDEVTAGWLSSAGHCANIMNPRFTEFGAARVESENADYPRYWTEVFAAPR